MANETHLAVKGRLTADPELRFTQSGAAVANFTIASNPRNYDRDTGEWVNGTGTFWRCSIWKEAAENVADALKKGDAVVAMGDIRSREYETRDGDKRTALELQVDAIGKDLRWASRTSGPAVQSEPGAWTPDQSANAWGQPDPAF